MTWTYTPGADTDLNRVRELIGDTDTSDQLLPDEAIQKYLPGGALAQANLYLSAAMAAQEIANKLARQANRVSAGGSSVGWGDRVKDYRDLAAELRRQAVTQGGGAGPFVGGISRSQKATTEADTDRVAPTFTRSLGDALPRDDDERVYWR